MNSIVTSSGAEIDFDNLNVSPIFVEDMVYAIGQLNRFTGHTNRRYTVLDHSIECFKYAKDQGWDDLACFVCAIHDLHEGIIGDINTPVKRKVPALKVFEKEIEDAAHGQWGVTELMSNYFSEVKQADLAMLIVERDTFLGPVPTKWDAEALVTVPCTRTPKHYGQKARREFYKCLGSLEQQSLPKAFTDALATFNSTQTS